MRPRTAALLLFAVAALFLVGVGLGVRLLRAGLATAGSLTEQRLRAIGLTAAQALSQGAQPTLLDNIARRSDLEAAYLLDAALRPVPVPGKSGLSISLLRLDPDRALRALSGEPAVGPAYHLEGDDGVVLAGYFAVPAAAGEAAPQLLVLEAGAAFSTLPAQLRATAWAAATVAFGLAALAVLLVLLALRAGLREERLRAEAERGELLRELAAMVAHELRNPLGTIRAGAELLRERSDPEIVSDILSEVARLSDLTTQFLQFSRDLPLSLSTVDVVELCRELCTRLRREYPDESALLLKVEGDVEVTLQADADRLRQVLLNLAQNAVQAMSGRGALRIFTRRLPGGGAEVQVSDDGPGLSAEARRSLFQPFHTTKPTGTGLGLTVARRIVEKHGGSLAVAEPGDTRRGACFVLRLPNAPPRSIPVRDDARD
jgi:signal transduction histidine kinase